MTARTILLVDDDEDLRQTLTEQLSLYEEFSVLQEANAGKGVATALGAVLGLAPWVGLTLMGLWVGAVWLWKYSSGGALLAFALFPIVAVGFHRSWLFVGWAALVALLIWSRHKENLIRLWSGTESRIGQAS